MLNCDLHVHTNHSRDGESSVEEILLQAEMVGLDAIAITDHDTMDGAWYAAGIKSPVLVIPGIEVSTAQGHLLALGGTGVIPPGLDVIETIRLAHVQGAVVILPHPFHIWRHAVGLKVKSALEAVDAIEVFNSRYIVGQANRKAARGARRVHKPAVGGSDAHHARFVGFGRTTIDAELTVESILDAIRAGKTVPGGKMTPLRTYTRQSIRSTWRRVRRHVHR